jgi:thiamine transport system permease protein
VDERRPALIPHRVVVALGVPPAVFLAVFFLWPLGAIIARGLDAGGVVDVVTDPGIRDVAWFTTWQATLSTLLTLAVGLPGAYALARFTFRGQRVVTALVTVPFVMPTVVVGAAFLALLPPRWHGTVAAILLAHVFFNYAVVVRTVGAMWRHLDPRLEDAARVLGASRWRTIREVTLPLLAPAVIASASIVFLFTFTSFGVVLLLGGPQHPTIEVEIFRRTTQVLDLRGAAALALVQLVAMVALLAWWSKGQAQRANALRLQPSAFVAARPRTLGQRAFLTANLAFMALFLGVPLARLVERSFATPSGYGLAYWRALGTEGRGTTRAVPPLETLLTSLRFAAVAVVLAVVLGGAAACAIAYARHHGRFLDTGLMLPLGTSAVTIGFGLLITMNRPPLDLRASFWLVPIGHALVAMPFVIRAALPVLRSIDPRLREAASVLGAAPWRAWREVDFALLRRALLVGAAFAFAVSIGEFGATSFLARTGTPTVPVAVARLLGRPGAVNAGQAYALSVILMAVTAIVMLAVERFRGGRESF